MAKSDGRGSEVVAAPVSPEYAEQIENEAARRTFDGDGSVYRSDIIREALAEYYDVSVEEIEP